MSPARWIILGVVVALAVTLAVQSLLRGRQYNPNRQRGHDPRSDQRDEMKDW